MAAVPDEDAKKWANEPREVRGISQLDQLHAMERQQDSNLWASQAIFTATQGILLIALFSGTDKPFAMVFLALVGLSVSVAWIITVVRARVYEKFWIDRAKKLQQDLGIPKQYTVWGDEPPRGIPGWTANALLIATFVVVWLIVIGLALGLAGLTFR